ncbi:ribbon-helix-helix protein, CopG family [Methanothrix soehngenii]|uniref:ribbon-helix-helix protein, CopG family n=1 Tax=Methanothrix soehngenii TaxID=2223 RepID=UPI00300DB4BF
MDANLAREVARAAKATGLTKAELMRQALAFGVPAVVKALLKPSGRVTAVAPLPAKQARALYRLQDDDRTQTSRLMAAQR